MKNPFIKASTKKKHLKISLYGAPGVGKTFFALGFPSPAVIDLKGGTRIDNPGYETFRPLMEESNMESEDGHGEVGHGEVRHYDEHEAMLRDAEFFQQHEKSS